MSDLDIDLYPRLNANGNESRFYDAWVLFGSEFAPPCPCGCSHRFFSLAVRTGHARVAAVTLHQKMLNSLTQAPSRYQPPKANPEWQTKPPPSLANPRPPRPNRPHPPWSTSPSWPVSPPSRYPAPYTAPRSSAKPPGRKCSPPYVRSATCRTCWPAAWPATKAAWLPSCCRPSPTRSSPTRYRRSWTASRSPATRPC